MDRDEDSDDKEDKEELDVPISWIIEELMLEEYFLLVLYQNCYYMFLQVHKEKNKLSYFLNYEYKECNHY